MNGVILCLFAAIFLTGCASRTTRVSIPSSENARLQSSYIDLQPGWRLRVVTPLTKSEIYEVAPDEGKREGGMITLAAGGDFLGYETSFYTVRPQGRKGVRIQFASGEQTKNGITSVEAHRQLQLFDLPRGDKYVRLLYLARVSRRDHNMAVIAARRRQLLATAKTGSGSV